MPYDAPVTADQTPVRMDGAFMLDALERLNPLASSEN